MTPRTIPELLKPQGIMIAPVPTMEVHTEKIIVNAPCFLSLSPAREAISGTLEFKSSCLTCSGILIISSLFKCSYPVPTAEYTFKLVYPLGVIITLVSVRLPEMLLEKSILLLFDFSTEFNKFSCIYLSIYKVYYYLFSST